MSMQCTGETVQPDQQQALMDNILCQCNVRAKRCNQNNNKTQGSESERVRLILCYDFRHFKRSPAKALCASQGSSEDAVLVVYGGVGSWGGWGGRGLGRGWG